MKTVKQVSTIQEGINRRFFIALNELVMSKHISSLESFCNEFGLSSPRYRELRLTYGITPKPDYQSRYKGIEIKALYNLCDVYSVSAEWLLLGRGKMFNKNEKNRKI
jgi:hypothetical protein